jgi:hypothetical protein
MKIVQVHLFNIKTGGVEVFDPDDIPEEEYIKFRLFAIYLEDGSTISC